MITPINMLLMPTKRKVVLSNCAAAIKTRLIQLGFTKGKSPSSMNTNAIALSSSVHMSAEPCQALFSVIGNYTPASFCKPTGCRVFPATRSAPGSC